MPQGDLLLRGVGLLVAAVLIGMWITRLQMDIRLQRGVQKLVRSLKNEAEECPPMFPEGFVALVSSLDIQRSFGGLEWTWKFRKWQRYAIMWGWIAIEFLVLPQPIDWVVACVTLLIWRAMEMVIDSLLEALDVLDDLRPPYSSGDSASLIEGWSDAWSCTSRALIGELLGKRRGIWSPSSSSYFSDDYLSMAAGWVIRRMFAPLSLEEMKATLQKVRDHNKQQAARRRRPTTED